MAAVTVRDERLSAVQRAARAAMQIADYVCGARAQGRAESAAAAQLPRQVFGDAVRHFRAMPDEVDVGHGLGAVHVAGDAVGELLELLDVVAVAVQEAGVTRVDEDDEPVAAIAIGYPGDPEILPEQYQQRQFSPRQRKPIQTFVFTGGWGQTSPVVKN